MMPASHSTALDAVQFERWITTFRGPLIGLCASWCGAWEAGEALAQRTLAEAWARRLEFDGDATSDAAAGAWLRRIARGALALVEAGPRPQLEASASHTAGVLPTDFDVLSAAFEALEFHEQTLLRTQYLEPASTAALVALLRLSDRRYRRAPGEVCSTWPSTRLASAGSRCSVSPSLGCTARLLHTS